MTELCIYLKDEIIKLEVTGRVFKIAKIKDEWLEDVQNIELLLQKILDCKDKADIFTFWQRLPWTIPKYNYYMEWDNVAAIPVKGYKFWRENQIDRKTRNMVRKAEKKGVEVKLVNFDDALVKGIMRIFNETPIRQGRPFWHYGKDFETIKRSFSEDIEKHDFIGAYYNRELIGFIRLTYAGRYAMLTQIISMVSHRDKAPTNALIAKSVEICEKKKISYLVYARMSRGTLGQFKRNNGFVKINLPRYYIPLTCKGKIILKLHLHNGIIGLLPEKLIDFFKLTEEWVFTRIYTKW